MICDFAEYYHIYDFMQFPLSYVATLVYELPEYSRTKLALSSMDFSFEQMLLASITDSLKLLVWSKTPDASTGANKPPSILATMTGHNEDKKYKSFDSGCEFKNAYAAIVGE